MPGRVHTGGASVPICQGIVDALPAEVVAAGKIERVAQKIVAARIAGRDRGKRRRHRLGRTVWCGMWLAEMATEVQDYGNETFV